MKRKLVVFLVVGAAGFGLIAWWAYTAPSRMRAERLFSQVRVGGTLKEARAVLGDPDSRSKHGSAYIWFVQRDDILVRIDPNQIVIGKELRKQTDRPTPQPLRSVGTWAKELIGLD